MNEQGAILLGDDTPVGSEVEPFTSLSLQMDAEFSLLAGRLDSIAEQTRPAQLAEPVNARIAGSATTAGGFAVIDVGGPAMGRLWDVVSLTLSGLTPTTSLGSGARGDVFISATDLRNFTSLTGLPMSDWRDVSLQPPQVAFYDHPGEMRLRGLEHLFMVVSSATSGIEVVAAATINEIEDGPALQVVVR